MERSTIDAFFANASRLGERPALRHHDGQRWQARSWTEYGREVRRAARGMMALGLPDGGRVAICGPNRPEWLIADLAAMTAAGVPLGIYSTSTPDQIAYVLQHSEATIVVLADAAMRERFRPLLAQAPSLRRVVLMQGEADDATSWQALLAAGDGVAESDLDARLAAIRADALGTLIYTSGTTGTPKGVMLTHGNLVAATHAGLNLIRTTSDEEVISYLPLSHIAEQIVSIHGPAVIGYGVSCCDRLDQLGEALRAVRPTLFFAVPRVWEKLQAKMVEAGAASPPLRRKIAAWARSVGLRAATAREQGRSLPFAYPLARKLVFSKVRERLGLDRARFCLSGAAPISRGTLEFFYSLDIPIYEVYGMSETTGAATFSYDGNARIGAVGRPLPGVELRIAEDGEILMRGPSISVGYYRNDEATLETIDADGWLHSGDIGEVDADGFLRITDRKKDLFKTAGGKYIAPQPIEGRLKAIPGIAQAMVVGDGRKYAVALLTLDAEAAPREAAACGVNARTLDEIAGDKRFVARVEEGIARVNADLGKWETIKRVKLLANDFTVESGELTPSLKLRRREVTRKYAAAIEALYAEGSRDAEA